MTAGLDEPNNLLRNYLNLVTRYSKWIECKLKSTNSPPLCVAFPERRYFMWECSCAQIFNSKQDTLIFENVKSCSLQNISCLWLSQLPHQDGQLVRRHPSLQIMLSNCYTHQPLPLKPARIEFV